MSRGLGWLQREILATLDDAKQQAHSYRGCEWQEHPGKTHERWASLHWRWDRPGWVRCCGARVRIADQVYDLRASLAYLTQKHNKLYCGKFTEEAFTAAFSRAAHGLVQRGSLRKLDLVPLAEYDEEKGGDVHFLSDGLFLFARDHQLRFVSKC